MANWKCNIDLRRPCWESYRELIGRLDDARFPDVACLNELLPPETLSGGGAPLRFVAASALPGVPYEQHIFETGQVPTREGQWHDLFNALVWCRWPRLKAALNAAHYRQLDGQDVGRGSGRRPGRGLGRGPGRDALTLLDESGALVIARNRVVLQALARRDWPAAFQLLRCAWQADARVLLCGHALLEKFLAPYKSMTAHALLLCLDTASLTGEGPILQVDSALAGRVLAGELCNAPADLAPLPLAGVPGWWAGAPQDAAFYADVAVFRPPAADLRPAVVQSLPPAHPSA
jgi:hypothetical protein